MEYGFGDEVVRYDSDGTGRHAAASIATGLFAQNNYLEAASDSQGNLLVVYNQGGYFEEDIGRHPPQNGGMAELCSPMGVNSHTDSMQKYPTVAINADGEGADRRSDLIKKRRWPAASGDGIQSGDEFVVTHYAQGDVLIESAVRQNGEFYVAWSVNYAASNGISGAETHAAGGTGRLGAHCVYLRWGPVLQSTAHSE